MASISPAKLLVEFARGGLVVEVGIVLIFELAGDERVGSAGGALSDVIDGALHTVGARCANHLSAERLHERDFFLRETFRHGEHGLVAAAAADQRQAHAGVAGGGFEDGRARLQAARRARPW